MEKRFEVLWYDNERKDGYYYTKEFRTRKEAINFYEKHKNDSDKCGWWVTHRDADWYVIEDIII